MAADVLSVTFHVFALEDGGLPPPKDTATHQPF